MDLIANGLHYALSFFFIISVIVFIHEFGHYYIARRCGVRVESFSIGFGKEIYGWTDKHGTRWKLSLFPLGGYVKMYGDYGAASTPDAAKLKRMSAKQKSEAFHFKSLKQKAAVVSAGPLANFVFAIVILSVFFWAYGRPETTPEVGSIVKESAAEEAGLKVGDRILSISGSTITRFEDIREVASMHPDEALDLTYQRGDKVHTATITPRLSETTDIFGNKIRVGLIGIGSTKVEYRALNPLQAFPAAVIEVYNISANTLKAIGQILTGRRSSDELSGILRIGQYSGQATTQGIAVILWFMAVLSVNLGLINLFPIPVLDGGHLMYYALEALKGRPLAEKFQEWGYRAGFAILMALMAFATYNDLKHFNIF